MLSFDDHSMKRISTLLLASSFLLLVGTENIAAQGLPAPADLGVPFSPIPVKADGKIQLLYELHVTNFRPQNLELTGVEIFKDEAKTKPLAGYKDAELIGMLARPGAGADLQDKR